MRALSTALLFSLVLAPAAVAAQEVYRHATGFSFRYPAGWQVQEVERGIAVLPSDAARDASGQPLELFLIGSEQAAGIERADDPQVVAYFEQSLAPMRRIGEVEPVQSGLGPGAMLTFEGSIGADAVRQRVYVVLHEGEGVYLLHVGREGLVAEREADARALFASFSWEADATRLDPNLVRTWSRSRTSGGFDASGSGYMTDRERITFFADGTVVYQTGTQISVDVPGASAYSPGEMSGRRGRWSADNGVLVVRWDEGGAERFQYNVFMHTDGAPALKIVVPGERNPRFYR